LDERSPLACPNGCVDAEFRKLGSSIPLDQKGRATSSRRMLYQCLECNEVFEVGRRDSSLGAEDPLPGG
jgi:hypothetical protein